MSEMELPNGWPITRPLKVMPERKGVGKRQTS
jgi:hypothetical protein